MNDTKAVIGTPQISAIPAAASDSQNAAYSIVLGVGLALLAIWKAASWVSKDKVGFKEDSARVDMITTLQNQLEKERAEKDKAMEEAREAWNTRTADAMKIAELTVTVKFLNETVGKLRQEIHAMRDKLAPAAMKDVIEEAESLALPNHTERRNDGF